MAEFEAKIFGGLPVTVEAHLEGAQRSLGIATHVEIDGIYTHRFRKRDKRVVARPIPQSWWSRLEKSGELAELEDESLTIC